MTLIKICGITNKRDAIAAAELADEPAAHRFQAAAVADHADPLAPPGAIHAHELAAIVQVFLDAHLGVEGRVLRLVADLRAGGGGVGDDVVPGDAGPPRV